MLFRVPVAIYIDTDAPRDPRDIAEEVACELIPTR